MKLYLIDGTSYVYRAFHAIRELRDSKGRPTNAIFGFTNTLMKIIRERRPDAVAVSFDSAAPTERHRLFDSYKAHRPETPGELIAQMPAIRKIVEAMGIGVFEIPGYEADDILATIAHRASKAGAEVFIVSGDKDMLQTVSDSVRIYDPIKDVVVDEAKVKERFGIPPGRISEFMALAGDSADNIPGVKGIGEKTARELLADFKSLDELLEHTGRIKKERIRRLIEENGDSARLSKKLAEIQRDVPLDFDVKDLLLKEPDRKTLIELFREFEFTSLLRYVPHESSVEMNYEAVLLAERLKEISEGLRGGFSIDTESTGLDPMRAGIVGLSICRKKGSAYYVPLVHEYEGAPAQMEKGLVFSILRPFLEDESIPKTGHNLKFDILLLENHGAGIRGALYDTMIASYLLNPLRPNHALEHVALEHLSREKRPFKDVAPGGDFARVGIDEACRYACDDAELAFGLREVLFPLISERGLEGVYFHIEMPLIRVLAGMERAGLKIDGEKLGGISKELEGEIGALKKRIFFLSGGEFNINSPKQLASVLFDALGLKPGKKKKTGYSTDMSVLEELSKTHELPAEILNFRSLFKLKNTYVDVLPGLVNPHTGRLHTSFNQTATATGRLSSSEPNLQNIPIRGPWGRRIREAFVAEEGRLLISADYSQIELRVLAHLSGDRALTEAFMADIDIHGRTASGLFGVAEDMVTPEMRRAAKGVNFGVIYGISPFGLGESLGIPQEEAEAYINRYFEKHPGVRAYMGKALDEAKKRGFAATLFGRKRPIPELKSPKTRALGERLALNSPIQGTAADIIKIAMINIYKALKGKGTKMLLQVHDELLFEAPRGELEEVLEIVKEEMEGVGLPPVFGGSAVPLKVEIGYGGNWAEAH